MDMNHQNNIISDSFHDHQPQQPMEKRLLSPVVEQAASSLLLTIIRKEEDEHHHHQEEEEEHDTQDDGDDEGWSSWNGIQENSSSIEQTSPGSISRDQVLDRLESLASESVPASAAASSFSSEIDIILRCRLLRLELPVSAFPGVEREQLVVTCELLAGGEEDEERDPQHEDDNSTLSYSCISSLPTSYQPQRGDVCWDQRLDLPPISLRTLCHASRLVLWLWSLARGEYPIGYAIIPLLSHDNATTGLSLGPQRLYISTRQDQEEEEEGIKSSHFQDVENEREQQPTATHEDAVLRKKRTQAMQTRRFSTSAVLEHVITPSPLASSAMARIHRALSEPFQQHQYTLRSPSPSMSTTFSFTWPSHGYLIIDLYAKQVEKQAVMMNRQSPVAPEEEATEATATSPPAEEEDADKDHDEEGGIIEAILAQSSDSIEEESKRRLLWDHRCNLLQDCRSLVKCLRLFAEYGNEASLQDFLGLWKERLHLMSLLDAIKLLSGHFSHPLIRGFAVEKLHQASNQEMVTYLLQLVQPLRYEPWDSSTNSSSSMDLSLSGVQREAKEERSSDKEEQEDNSSSKYLEEDLLASLPMNMTMLPRFLIYRACQSVEVANDLYWYLSTEMHDRIHGRMFEAVRFSFLYALRERNYKVYTQITVQAGWFKKIGKVHARVRETSYLRDRKETLLRELLAEEDINQVSIPVPLPIDPSIMVNQLDSKGASIFGSKTYPAFISFHLNKEAVPKDESLLASPTVILKKGERGGGEAGLATLSPEEQVKEDLAAAVVVLEEERDVPSDLLLNISAEYGDKKEKTDDNNNGGKILIFKAGEDLRQDQLVVQIIALVDDLLKRHHQLDLRLTHYHVLATGPKEGLIEHVPHSQTVSEILASKGKILGFLRTCSSIASTHHQEDQDLEPSISSSASALGVDVHVMENYIRSLAGYCVLTHILGIGDRHLHNVMLQADGRFFHLDFGFILGSDPKPMPGPFRLSTPMIDGMGGRDHPNYPRFKFSCVKAFKALRQHASLIIGLISLTIDVNLKDFNRHGKGERDPQRILAKLEERFRLDLSEEEAEEHFQQLIGKALSAVAPRVHEALHNLVVR